MSQASARGRVEAGSDSLIRSISDWRPGELPQKVDHDAPVQNDTIRWFDIVSGSDATKALFDDLRASCPGLTREMLADVLTPDEHPAGSVYGDESIRLASTFSVAARRLEEKTARGTAQHAGVLTFQPVELLAGDGWLLSCWHPTRTFAGTAPVAEGAPGSAEATIKAVSVAWQKTECLQAGDLGVLVMDELATGYKAAGWALAAWHEDWELSLYVDDELSSADELPYLWGSMAVLRDWLNPLNKPGLRKDPSFAWLPATNHDNVIALDDRIDKTLDHLRSLSNVMRSSFSLLHVQLADEERKRRERTQNRVELGAAIFLVPTLIVGFYGANTWVPGQGRHWGFWVMVAVLVFASTGVVYYVLKMRRDEQSEVERVAAERIRIRKELLRGFE